LPRPSDARRYMSGSKIDRLTDYIAVGFATLVAVTIWALFLWEYIKTGSVPQWLMATAVLMTFLAVLTLFGKEKVSAALDALRNS
jgi:hypothetical protein